MSISLTWGGESHTLLTSSDIVNNVSTYASDKALSATQGTYLNDRIDSLSKLKILGGGITSMYFSNSSTLTCTLGLPTAFVRSSTFIALTILARSQTPYNQLKQELVLSATEGSRSATVYAYGSFVSGHVLELSWTMFEC